MSYPVNSPKETPTFSDDRAAQSKPNIFFRCLPHLKKASRQKENPTRTIPLSTVFYGCFPLISHLKGRIKFGGQEVRTQTSPGHGRISGGTAQKPIDTKNQYAICGQDAGGVNYICLSQERPFESINLRIEKGDIIEYPETISDDAKTLLKKVDETVVKLIKYRDFKNFLVKDTYIEKEIAFILNFFEGFRNDVITAHDEQKQIEAGQGKIVAKGKFLGKDKDPNSNSAQFDKDIINNMTFFIKRIDLNLKLLSEGNGKTTVKSLFEDPRNPGDLKLDEFIAALNRSSIPSGFKAPANRIALDEFILKAEETISQAQKLAKNYIPAIRKRSRFNDNRSTLNDAGQNKALENHLETHMQMQIEDLRQCSDTLQSKLTELKPLLEGEKEQEIMERLKDYELAQQSPITDDHMEKLPKLAKEVLVLMLNIKEIENDFAILNRLEKIRHVEDKLVGRIGAYDYWAKTPSSHTMKKARGFWIGLKRHVSYGLSPFHQDMKKYTAGTAEFASKKAQEWVTEPIYNLKETLTNRRNSAFWSTADFHEWEGNFPNPLAGMSKPMAKYLVPMFNLLSELDTWFAAKMDEIGASDNAVRTERAKYIAASNMIFSGDALNAAGSRDTPSVPYNISRLGNIESKTSTGGKKVFEVEVLQLIAQLNKNYQEKIENGYISTDYQIKHALKHPKDFFDRLQEYGTFSENLTLNLKKTVKKPSILLNREKDRGQILARAVDKILSGSVGWSVGAPRSKTLGFAMLAQSIADNERASEIKVAALFNAHISAISYIPVFGNFIGKWLELGYDWKHMAGGGTLQVTDLDDHPPCHLPE